MVQVDLATILAVKPENLQSQDKEDLYENLANLDVEPTLPPDKCRMLLEVTRSVLRYKGEQVESLLSELDIIASSGDGVEEIRDEFVKAKRQNEQLIDQLEKKDEQMLKDRTLIDKLSVQVNELEKEKTELENELSSLRDERLANIASQAADDLSENMEHVKEALQNKNKHILQLLADIEVTERENEKLRSKISHLRSELAEATTSLTKTSGENITIRETNYQNQEKISILEDRNTVLVNQVSDLVRERNEQDAKLDELIDALETRVAKWQEILSQKDSELADLQLRLKEYENNDQNQHFTSYSTLSQTLSAHEDKVKQLEGQLALATTDLQESTRLLQEFKKKAESRESSEDSESQVGYAREELEKAHSEITILEERLKDAEQDAQQRAEEMTEMIIQLREYEEGRYGLKEAREEIQELRRQVATRDKQVLRLVDQANQLHMKLGDKITLTPGELYCSEEGEIPDLLDSHGLRTQLQQVQQTAINLSMQNYDLKAEVIKLKQEIDKEKSEVQDHGKPEPKTIDLAEEYVQTDSGTEKDFTTPALPEEQVKSAEERLVDVIEENEALRRGLHEILESIRSHDAGSKSVSIQSECLESLLEALDSRSVSGWYHPAMRLQAALNKMQGTNQELRQQIRESRLRESYLQAELQAAMMRLDQLELELENLARENLEMMKPREPPKPPPRLHSQTSKATSASQDDGSSDGHPGNGQSNGNGSYPPNGHNNSQESDHEPSEHVKDKSEGTASSKSQKSQVRKDSTKPSETDEQEQPTNEVDEEFVEVVEEVDNDENLNEPVDPTEVEQIEEPKSFVDNETQTEPQVPSRNGSRQSQRSMSGEKSISPVLKDDNGIKEKCEELRKDLESIRVSTEEALKRMAVSKEELSKDIRELIQNFEEKLIASNKAEKYTELITVQEAKLIQMEAEVNVFKTTLHEKELELSSKEVILTDLRKQLTIPKIPVTDDTQILALKTTVTALQNLISKKEEVIDRYQKLIQENSEEHNKLMEQYKTLEAHSKRLSSPSNQKLTDSRAITLLMEKWLGRVHGLEDQVCSLAQQLSAANTEIQVAIHECQHWKAIAQKVDEKQSDQLEEVLEERRREIEELRTSIDQIKLEYEMKSKERLRNEMNKFRKKEEDQKSKMKSLEGEIARLKQHSRSSTYKNTTNMTKKEYLLMDKIKSLEEELQAYKLKEQSNIQHRRDRCAEEVSKWEERKRLQGQVERLRSELKDRGCLVEALELQVSRLKVIVSRMERERIALQRRLKTSQDNLSKFVLNPSSRDSKANQMEDGVRNFDSGMEASPIGNTPRSRPGSSNESVTLGEPKSRGRSRQDLERAVVSLKKVVAKLRTENKLCNKDYVEQIRDELKKTQESYVDAVDNNMALEEKFKEAEREIHRLRQQTFIVDGGGDRAESAALREQLQQKCELLSKVKVLLQRAMLREKQLMDQVQKLRLMIPTEKLHGLSDL